MNLLGIHGLPELPLKVEPVAKGDLEKIFVGSDATRRIYIKQVARRYDRQI